MISTGFSALDNCIGGLKKGKLYCLAGFNFTPEWIVEHFAINMIANAGRSGFVYTDLWGGNNPEVWGNKIFFSVGEHGNAVDFLPDVNNGFHLYQDKAVKTARIEEICGRFSALQRITPFDIAVFDMQKIYLPKRKYPYTSGKRAEHITGIFQKLAEVYNIPIILLDEFCNFDIAEQVSTNQFRRFLCDLGHDCELGFVFDWDEHMPSIQLKPTSYSNTLQKSVENLIVICRLPCHDTQFDLAVFQQDERVAEFEVRSYVEDDISSENNK